MKKSWDAGELGGWDAGWWAKAHPTRTQGCWDAGMLGRKNAGNHEHPLSDGALRSWCFNSRLYDKEASARNAMAGTLGERLGDRVPASGVGRRGPFPEGRCSSRFETVDSPGTVRAGALDSPLSPPWSHCAPEGRGWNLRAGKATQGSLGGSIAFLRFVPCDRLFGGTV